MPGDRPEIQIRDMTPEDTEGVLALCQHTLCGDDYLPGVLEARMADPNVRVRVGVTRDGLVLGVHLYRRLDEAQCWLSGLRIDPSVRGQGLARLFLEDGIALARADGMQKLRYTSEVANEVIHRLSEKFQLRPRGVWLAFERTLDPLICGQEQESRTRDYGSHRVKPEERSRILSLLRAKGRNLLVDSWTWRTLDDQTLGRLIDAGQALVCWSETGGWSTAFVMKDPRDDLEITLLGTEPSCAQSLLGHLKRNACESGTPVRMTVHVPQEDPAAALLASLAKRGELRTLSDHPLRVWELDLAPVTLRGTNCGPAT